MRGKSSFRQRAHANPFSDYDIENPISPEHFDTSAVYGTRRTVTVLDLGSGYGSFAVSLAKIMPNETILGAEIRVRVVDYATLSAKESGLPNVGFVRMNAMRFLQNYIGKEQLSKLFILYPDPHFKKRKHKARIITPELLAVYEYMLQPGGRLYIATDVYELFTWATECVEMSPFFRKCEPEPDVLRLMLTGTDETQKVDLKKGSKHAACYEKIE